MQRAPALRLRTTVEAAPAYELVLSLSVAASSERAPRSAWLDDALERAGPVLLEQARDFCGGCDMVWAHLLSVAYENAAARHDLDAYLARLAELPPAELRLRLLGYYVRWFRRATEPHVIAAAARGDPQARRELLATSYPDDARWQSGLRALLGTGPLESKRRCVGIVRRWRERVFEPFLRDRLLGSLEREARLRRPAVRSEGLGAVAALIGGWEYIPEPGVSHLLLIPSVVIAPDLHVFDHQQVKFICYPVEEGAHAAAGPPTALVRGLRALADERRLRILRALRAEELTATELATTLDVGLTTLVHHLDQLRDAGLVVSSEGRRRAYRCAPTAGLTRDVTAYLEGEP